MTVDRSCYRPLPSASSRLHRAKPHYLFFFQNHHHLFWLFGPLLSSPSTSGRVIMYNFWIVSYTLKCFPKASCPQFAGILDDLAVIVKLFTTFNRALSTVLRTLQSFRIKFSFSHKYDSASHLLLDDFVLQTMHCFPLHPYTFNPFNLAVNCHKSCVSRHAITILLY